jgi:molecular chaperone GrpE
MSYGKEEEYLNLARQIQADFDNFRRRSSEQVKTSYEKGQASVIEVFLPCLDTFKEAKKMITDESVLKGVEMIEDKISSALSELGVKKIESIGEKYNPHFHNVIAVLKNEDKENDIILDEYQAGYIYNDKVIRYAKVIVNKKED